MNTSASLSGLIGGLLTAACMVLGIRQLLEKGYLLNNAWIYASKEEREKMNKRPYYRQSGICFLMIGAYILLMTLYAAFNAWYMPSHPPP